MAVKLRRSAIRQPQGGNPDCL
ncbi:hypothetical protein CA223_01140 [Sphingomonas koreensis]|uniref:Uncharacterized protein n=1 Tax=Sphingomonas koreensis TaxID=93064 RepID=A0AAJ4VCJ2_9SPHN|nr:hypothetical protein CA224_10960 [Sphingomonas koreensis]RSU28943.1 hypothetical protein CA225_08485 [Sphingomonas koreensis]RSU29845.1 hypothetical protein CA222_03940 [Sphingomonas koreensis]RSU36547.1 hypothetical protein BRX39_06550 [Sphingomonas koreensis]RSU43204.1 hypothetical protein BRX38_05595 [Sphingomonas koreensis]